MKVSSDNNSTSSNYSYSSSGLSGLASGVDTESMVKSMLSGIQTKIDQQNQMIAAQNRSIADHTAAVNSVRSAVQDNTCAINAYRTQF